MLKGSGTIFLFLFLLHADPFTLSPVHRFLPLLPLMIDFSLIIIISSFILQLDHPFSSFLSLFLPCFTDPFLLLSLLLSSGWDLVAAIVFGDQVLAGHCCKCLAVSSLQATAEGSWSLGSWNSSPLAAPVAASFSSVDSHLFYLAGADFRLPFLTTLGLEPFLIIPQASSPGNCQ